MNENTYHQVSNTLLYNEIVDYSDVVGASPVGTVPATSSFSTLHSASIYCAETTASRRKKHIYFYFGVTCIRDFMVRRIT